MITASEVAALKVSDCLIRTTRSREMAGVVTERGEREIYVKWADGNNGILTVGRDYADIRLA